MVKVATFGEIMLRLATPGNSRFVQAKNFAVNYGGGEANVAISLANYGLQSAFITKLPAHEIGQAAVNHLRQFGVDTNCIVRGGERIGIYYLETGVAMRPSKVIYDRAHSAIAEASDNDFDFNQILAGRDWLHCTGITPALSSKAAELTEQILIAAKKNNLMVSMDLNYRKKLWTPEQAQQVMTKLMQYVDVCIGNEEDIEKTLGYKIAKTDVTAGKLDLSGYQDVFQKVQQKFKFKYIATSLRESYSASDNGWSALIYDGNEFYHSHHYDIRIVDRVGAGDSFAGGLIYGLLTKKNYKEAVEFAVAASALKHTIPGDCNLVSKEEVEALLAGDVSGRVQR
ncbi:MAG: sugar kinase [Gammaproteobacteria bacterium]|jgi:2-dehydro-3-deoxygluconokinase